MAKQNYSHRILDDKKGNAKNAWDVLYRRVN